MITCIRCTTVNPSTSDTCSQCGADLLPGESAVSRFVYIALGVFVAAALSGTALLLLTTAAANPVTRWAAPLLISAGVIFMGLAIYVALYKTPLWQRYAARARRHVDIDAQQALSDYTEALKLAPERDKLGLLEGRLAMAEKVGADDIVLPDLLALQQAYAELAKRSSASERSDLAMKQITIFEKLEKAYTKAEDKDKALITHLAYLAWVEEHIEDIVSTSPSKDSLTSFITGVPANEQQVIRDFQPRYLLVNQVKDDRARLVQSGAVAAVGYCAECRQVYRLKASLNCPYNAKHGRLTLVEYVLPQEVALAESRLRQKMSERLKTAQAA